jgi:hypothetical protein
MFDANMDFHANDRAFSRDVVGMVRKASEFSKSLSFIGIFAPQASGLAKWLR